MRSVGRQPLRSHLQAAGRHLLAARGQGAGGGGIVATPAHGAHLSRSGIVTNYLWEILVQNSNYRGLYIIQYIHYPLYLPIYR